MSYILDALRKSEQERQRGKLPDLNSYKDDAAVLAPRRNIWPWITLAVVSVNLALLAFFWSPFREQNTPASAAIPAPVQSMPAISAPAVAQATQQAIQPAPQPAIQQSSSPQQPSPQVPPPAIAQQPAQAPPMPAPQVPVTTSVDNRPPIQGSPTLVSPRTPDYQPPMEDSFQNELPPGVAYIPQLEELPAYARSGIPDMTFSSHMYSSMPRFRSIIINGKRLKEGEYFTENLRVREITEKGVVMSNGTVLFSVDVLGRWAQ